MGTLRIQILASYLVLVVVLSAIVSPVFLVQFEDDRTFQRVLSEGITESGHQQDLRDAILRQHNAIARFISGDQRTGNTEYLAATGAARRVINLASNDNPKDIEDFVQAYTQFEKIANDLVLFHPPTTADEAVKRFTTEIIPLQARLRGTLNAWQARRQSALHDKADKIRQRSETVARRTLAAIAATFCATLFVAYVFIRRILKPLRGLADHAQLIGSGNLDQRVTYRRSDEIGSLADSINLMTDRLQEAREREAKRLQSAEQRSGVALEFLYDPVLVTSPDGTLILLNRAAKSLFGDIQGTKIEESGIKKSITTAIHRAIEEDFVTDSDDNSTLVTLQSKFYRLRATPMKNEANEILGSVCVLEDITHLKEVDALKDEFIGVASHELRTPVASMLLGTQLLAKGAVGELTPAQLEVVNTQLEDLERLHRTMQELLDLTRLEGKAAQPKLAPIGPKSLLDAAYNAVKAKATDKSVELTVTASDDLPQVVADQGQITRVLINLADNAVRHTPSNGSVHLTALATPDGVEFTVGDTGQGIPKEYLSRVLERFVQVPGATQGGAGLGLAIAQAILKAHGTHMIVQSTVGEGSKFSFTLVAKTAESGVKHS